MKVYIAGPLFSDGERAFNLKIDSIIRDCGHETYLPQRDGGIVAQMPDMIDGVPKETYVFRKDCENLKSCDLFLLLMDGRVPDEGACVALGFCLAHGKHCIGYKTDSRSGYDGKDNIMLLGALDPILHDEEELRNFFIQTCSLFTKPHVSGEKTDNARL